MHQIENIIAQTKKWITEVVIGCNFCPFAAPVVKRNAARFIVVQSPQADTCMEALAAECQLLDTDDTIETTLIILPTGFDDFNSYLDLAALGEELIESLGYEGIYQVASFHPKYCFEGTADDDAANYTNRSIYPMLHLLREASVEQALKTYLHPEQIPEHNIQFAHEKGVEYMRMLRDSCL